MTKTFEKDLNEKLNSEKVPMYITQKGCSLTRKTFIETNWIFDNYKNWHSDEEFQELLDKYSNLNDNYEKEVIRSSKIESQIIDLKSQLQQQALPVVPECVAKTVELLKNNPESSWSKLYSSLGEEGVDWLNEFQHKDERFGFGELNNKLFVLFHLAINGYTVEKPQLFYLKNKLTRLYLFKAFGYSKYGEQYELRKEKDFQFTQREIDSMETGSYEKIEVAE
ncbi:DUF1642 domain-containing protein [Lactococcus sp. NH2-7C]|uniref:DUF1642 domain-containing protein n=1 Tax=Lactococcus sp. NH2-7C TaxID=2879149 RepID=UPI001CDBBF2C|nr:DUF1642 domain-containing protein [Lactococcus sp. NH2-7C]MCA2391264.1 DUF1642 domain-containing protein [Lactococcus sp. NH2-7C]WGV30769.1 DUF1642 domain-containing protein [Lactococcus sp. NH2-7C]